MGRCRFPRVDPLFRPQLPSLLSTRRGVIGTGSGAAVTVELLPRLPIRGAARRSMTDRHIPSQSLDLSAGGPRRRWSSEHRRCHQKPWLSHAHPGTDRGRCFGTWHLLHDHLGSIPDRTHRARLVIEQVLSVIIAHRVAADGNDAAEDTVGSGDVQLLSCAAPRSRSS